MPDLSVLIPARNEMWLQRTIEDVFAHAKADTEVIVVLDGQWPETPIADHKRLRVTHSETVIGQRAATNLAARMSTATYVMKLDAHCSLDDGFDVKLIEADKEIGRPDLTQIPAMYNLRAFQWKCGRCGRETYQGPTPRVCESCTQAGPFERVVYWDLLAGGKQHKIRTEFWRFDHELHFQYDNDRKHRPDAKGELVDVMSSIGACFFMRRDRFFEIGGLDEGHGSWGGYGTEIACKSWLSGGRQIVNKRTWFAHLFRTQGADFGFPYANPGSAVDRARKYSQDLWFNNKWPGQQYPLSWLLEKFAPVKDWHDPIGEKRLSAVRAAGVAFEQRTRLVGAIATSAVEMEVAAVAAGAAPATGLSAAGRSWTGLIDGDEAARERDGADRLQPSDVIVHRPHSIDSKGLIYYSDLRGDLQVLQTVRDQLLRASNGLPIVSATLGRLDFGVKNLVPRQCAAVDCRHIDWSTVRQRTCPKCGARSVAGFRSVFNTLERGYLTMFRQQLAALEALDTEIAFMCEHDVLYSPTHFAFTPPRDDTFYYNQHTWRVNVDTGQAVFYYCNQVSGLCASRTLLVHHYRQVVEYVERYGFDRAIGFEPGGNRRQQELFGKFPVETWMSPACNVDIKTSACLTKWRGSPDDFRNKATCQGWQERDDVPGWGVTKGRVPAFLAALSAGSPTRSVA